MTSFSLIYTLIIIVAVVVVILGSVAYLVLAERKVSAYVQDRVGPNRVGPYGLLQPVADGLKLFLKEDIIPSHVDKLFFVMAPAIAVATALLAFTIVPFGPTPIPPNPVPVVQGNLDSAIDTYNQQIAAYQEEYTLAIAPGLDIGILLTYAIGSLAVYGVILGGWSANNKYSLLGSLRSSAQIISYEIPLGMSILGVVLFCGSLNLEKMIDWQAHNGWFVLYQPLAFLLFMVAVFAECNRLPFDLPEAEQELVGGYHTEYSSMKLGLFLMSEYVHMITTSFLMAIVFFGGWHFPGLSDVSGSWGLILKFGILAFKVACFIMLYLLVRWTIPRFRFDQLMSLAWQGLIPLALLNLVCVMIVQEYGLSKWILTGTSIFLLLGAATIGTREKPRTKSVLEPVSQ
jgi:NADH-quinone oxidoreductase subunit H